MDSRKSKMARIIDIPEHVDEYGTIHIADYDLPFEVRRVLWIDNLKSGRGEKAQKECEQIYVILHGRINVIVFRHGWEAFMLNNPSKGLYLPKMTWRSIQNPSYDAMLLVLCSHHYDSGDKIADMNEFIEALK